MADHFAAFSFVDRITALEPGARARGRYAVPGDIAAFPSCLVAEAVGQLAAWVAMAHVSFRGRPIAALANETRFHRDVVPGQALELGVEIESCDDDTVAYAGWAKVDGDVVIELVDCLGPMLPVAEFDAPEALAQRYELLRGPGATPARFGGVATPQTIPGEQTPDRRSATLHVPSAAPFFADHFPRRPVFPATLLLDIQIRLGLQLAAQSHPHASGALPVPLRMTHVKMRSFTPPGAVLELVAQQAPADASRAADSGKILLSAQANGKTVATARLEYAMRAAAHPPQTPAHNDTPHATTAHRAPTTNREGAAP